MSEESRDLVARAQGGDRKAADDLLRLHLPGLHAFVRLRAGAPITGEESVSDLVQSTCREVIQRLDRFRYEGEDGFRWWLYTTALRKIRDRYDHRIAAKRDVRKKVALDPGGDRSAEPNLLAAYSSNLLGITCVALVKIRHVRPYKTNLILAAQDAIAGGGRGGGAMSTTR